MGIGVFDLQQKIVNFLQQDMLRSPCYGRPAMQHGCAAVQVGDARGGLSRGIDRRGIDRELVESVKREGRLFDGLVGVISLGAFGISPGSGGSLSFVG
jgi:hypothetical protein